MLPACPKKPMDPTSDRGAPPASIVHTQEKEKDPNHRIPDVGDSQAVIGITRDYVEINRIKQRILVS
jgi:hypothetical protein